MITIMPSYKWKKGDKQQLATLLGYDKAVHIAGMQVDPYIPWQGYAQDIPYGSAIVVKEGRTVYSFKKRTDGTVQVF